mgnify:CR=1 FL=1
MKKIILIISAALLAVGILGCVFTALPTVLEGEKYMNGIIDSKSTKTQKSRSLLLQILFQDLI